MLSLRVSTIDIGERARKQTCMSEHEHGWDKCKVLPQGTIASIQKLRQTAV